MADTTVANTTADYTLPDSSKTKTRRPVQELGQNEFLQLMMAQMSNQDPMEPTDNSAMIAQMAQFSSLTAMTNMATTMTQSQTYSMIGKGVMGTYSDAATGKEYLIVGQVESAGVDKTDGAFVVVDGKKILQKNIEQVFDEKAITGDNSSLLSGSALVGMNVVAEVKDADGYKTYITGQVEKLVIVDGKFLVQLQDGTRVGLYQVSEVAKDAIDITDQLAQAEKEKSEAIEAEKEAAEEAEDTGETGGDDTSGGASETPDETEEV